VIRFCQSWLVIIVILLIFNQTAMAQNTSFGVQGNFNSAKFIRNENTTANINEKIGFGGGIYLSYTANRLLTVRGEVLLNQKGADIEQSYSRVDSIAEYRFEHYNTSDTRLNYLELPITWSFNLPSTYDPKLNLSFGFYVSLLLSGDQVNYGSTLSGSILLADSNYITKAIRKNDYGIVLGGSIPMGNLELGGRYSLGLPHVIRADIKEVDYKVDYRNRVLSLIIGYRIR
jgi:hypothetical protein